MKSKERESDDFDDFEDDFSDIEEQEEKGGEVGSLEQGDIEEDLMGVEQGGNLIQVRPREPPVV